MAPDPVTVDAALADALRADMTGELCGHVTDLAAAAWRMSCRPTGDAAEALRRLADVLRETVCQDAPAGPPRARQPAPIPTQPAPIPRWLTDARDVMLSPSDGRLAIGSAGVADVQALWRQLHLDTLWMPESQRRQSLELLRADPEDQDHLIPPLEEVAEAGISWAAAAAHPAAAAALAGWPREPDDPLPALIGTAFTIADLAPGLFMVDGSGGVEIRPAGTERDRQAFQDRVVGALTRLAADGTSPRLRVDWLAELDEALRSLFPVPLPSKFSLWTKRLESSLSVLTSYAGAVSADAEVRLVPAGTAYEDRTRSQFADGSNVPVRPFRDAELNKVLWPLRAYVRLPGEPGTAPLVRHGRVIYGHHLGAVLRP